MLKNERKKKNFYWVGADVYIHTDNKINCIEG